MVEIRNKLHSTLFIINFTTVARYEAQRINHSGFRPRGLIFVPHNSQPLSN